MADRTPLHPLFAELVEHIAIASRSDGFGIEKAIKLFEAKSEEVILAALAEAPEHADEEQVASDARANVPDAATFLEALAAAGVDVDAGVDAEIEATAAALLGHAPDPNKVAADAEIAAYYGADASLTTESLWKRDALRHRILNRAEEAELTHRYALFARTAKTLRASRDRSNLRLAALSDEVNARVETLIEAERAKRPSQRKIAAAVKALAESRRKLMELSAEIVRISLEIEDADEAAKRAESTFLAHNFKLVAHMTYKKFNQIRRRGDVMDLIQQGNLGMLDAFRKFDPTRGFKFSTFATWYINQKLSEWGYEQIGAIRVPTHRWRDARKIEQFKRDYYKAYGAEPSADEIAEGLGKSVKSINEVLRAQELMRTGSLDKPIGEDDDSATLGDLVEDRRSLSPEREAVSGSLGPIFEHAFARRLDARERRVLQMRFGMYDGESKTLEWIGDRMKITRERVRQIEAKAFEKLREDPEIRQMLGEDVIAAMLARKNAA
jgi:RNA polymerase sigma factor (sigma-70 family)